MTQIAEKSTTDKNVIEKPTVVSLFCGAGGMDYGFKIAGFKTIWATDIDEITLKTFLKNLNSNIIKKDIRELSANEIPDNPDVIIGGFPCQGFSSAGKRNTCDVRNSLAWEMIRIINKKRPKFFVGENVLGIRSMKLPNGDLILDKLIKDIKEIGYNVEYRLLNAKDFGVPQDRKRIFLIGNRLNLPIKFPKPTHHKGNWKTLRSAIDSLPNPDKIDPSTYSIKNHEYKPLAPSDLAIVKYIPPGKNWKSVPYENLTNRLKKIKDNLKFYKSPAFYKRPLFDATTGTVSATMNPTHCTALHPIENRRFTVREAARIQSFPDDFVFIGSITQCYKQVGNAVPPKLAYHVARVIKNQLQEEKIQKKESISDFL